MSENKLRENICQFATSLFDRGITHGSTGNISVRLNDYEILVRNKKGPQKSGQIKIDANILNEERRIQENLGLNIKIENKKNNSGKITILYKNLEQFELVSNLLKRN